MNATKEKQKTAEDYLLLPVKDIVPSPDNPRIINEKNQEFLDLVDSIKAMGVIIPLHVRVHPKEKEKYELLAGERRLLAAAKAGRETVRAISHGELSNEEAFEITFAENFAREDLTPLEESKAVETVMCRYKGDTKAVASKMGKSVCWVLQRIAVQKNLSKEWKEAIVEEDCFFKWTTSHLQLVAAFPQDVQPQLLEELTDYRNVEEVISVGELEKQLAEWLRLLSKAPWDLSDKTLAKKPPCSKCHKRSSHQPGLFDDTTDEEEIKKNDRCLDRRCWDEKMEAHIDRRADSLKKEYPNLVYAVMPETKLNYYQEKELYMRFGYIVEKWKASTKDAAGALPALIVFGKEAGTIKYIKAEGTKATTTRFRKGRPLGADGKRKPTTLKERRALLDRERWFVVIRHLIERVGKSGVKEIVSEDRILTVMALAVTFGTSRKVVYDPTDKSAGVTGWDGFCKLTDRDEVLDYLWRSMRGTLCSELTYCGPITQISDELIADAKNTSKLLGIDINAMFKEASKKDYPEPKSWAGLKEDGTPKAKKTAEKKTAEKKAAGEKAPKKTNKSKAKTK